MRGRATAILLGLSLLALAPMALARARRGLRAGELGDLGAAAHQRVVAAATASCIDAVLAARAACAGASSPCAPEPAVVAARRGGAGRHPGRLSRR
ncbi:MAG: hypothetical protein U0802_14770 [Candidatus Binatia bacterium]